MASSCALVRDSTRRVVASSHRVKIIQRKVEQVVGDMDQGTIAQVLGPKAFDGDGTHFCDPHDDDLTALYILCVDSINFCFWPDHDVVLPLKQAKKHYHQFDVTARYLLNSGLPVEDTNPKILVGTPLDDESDETKKWSKDTLAVQGLEYEHIAGGLKRALQKDRTCLDPTRLKEMTGEKLRALIGWPRELPLEKERARLLREIGTGLTRHWDGKVSNLVTASTKSASNLVDLVTQTFPGFRDQTTDPRDGSQVFFFKRAQIFVGDLWGRFNGEGLGDFGDSIHELTMFADYRVPVVLRELGILKYADEFAALVDAGYQIAPGSADEIDLRACTVQAVERMKQCLESRLAKESWDGTPALAVTSVALDWFLWTAGEKRRDDSSAHHKTLTVFY